MGKPNVYFTKELTPEVVTRIYEALNITLPGKVAVKVYSEGVGNQNPIRPAFMKPMIDSVNGTTVECNTAYKGKCNTSRKHWETAELYGWTDISQVDILDEDGDLELKVNGGKRIDKNFMGSHMENCDSLLILPHFKGHPMGGFGGALKNVSVGTASSYGKAYICGAGNPDAMWTVERNASLESMAGASKTITEYFSDHIAFINIMCNMSVDCDCCAVAEDPKIGGIDILAPLDPVALDRACLDLVYRSDDPGEKDLIERIESRHGIHIVKTTEEIGVGNREYRLMKI